MGETPNSEADVMQHIVATIKTPLAVLKEAPKRYETEIDRPKSDARNLMRC